jgi:uncharacterized membrane protein
MAKSTTGYGVLLIVVGVVAYVATSMASVTALIPSFFGLVFVAIGALGRNERFAKPSLYAALVLAVLGLFGSLSGIPQVFTLLTGGDVARPAASIARAIMAVVLLAMVASLIRALRR